MDNSVNHLTPGPSPKERGVLSPAGGSIPLLSPAGGGRGRSFLPSCFIAALTRKQRTTRDVIAGLTRNPQCVRTIALMLFVAWSWFSCNNNATNPNRVQNPVRVETTATVLPADSLFEPTGNAQLDSLLRLTAVAKQDTVLARLYFDIGEMYLNYDSEKATTYYLKLRDLSEKLNWNEGYYLFAAGYTDILNREGLIDSAIVIHRQALELAKKDRNELRIALISSHIGTCYLFKSWYETALNYYYDALPLFEKREEKTRLAHLYSLMSTVYYHINMLDESILYSEKALSIYNNTPDAFQRAMCLINYNVVLFRKRDFEKAEKCLIEAQRIFILNNNRYHLCAIYSNLGNIALQCFELDKSEMYAGKALEIAEEFGDINASCISIRGLGHIEMYRGNIRKAEEYAKKSLEKAIENDFSTEKMGRVSNSLKSIIFAPKNV